MLKFINGGIGLVDRLVSFGDSCIFGSELKDVYDDYIPSKLTYPAIISRQLNLEYLCLAKPGASNQYIVKTFLDYPFKGTEIIIIQWANSIRFGLHLEHGWQDLSPNFKDIQRAKNLAEVLYKNIEVKQFSQFQFRMCLATVLQSVNCPIIMTSNDEVPSFNNMITKFDGKSFLEFSKSYSHGPLGHPLEGAHNHAAKCIKPFVEKFISR